jgi:hypothetical protein
MKNLIITIYILFPLLVFSQNKADTSYNIVVFNKSKQQISLTIESGSSIKVKMSNEKVYKGKVKFINDSQFYFLKTPNEKLNLSNVVYIRKIKTEKRAVGLGLAGVATVLAIKGAFFSDNSGNIIDDGIGYLIISEFVYASSIPFFINKRYKMEKYQLKTQRVIKQLTN